MKAIEIKNLYFKYTKDSPLILKDINMSVEYGKITLLTGPSGSGKSTILSIVSGIIPHIERGLIKGDIFIDGKNTKDLKMKDITKSVGITLQNADEQITSEIVEDEIAFGLENMNKSREDIKNSIDTICSVMSLDKYKKCRSLSGGEKERLIFACTLALDKKIVILDEPLANLDSKGCDILMNALLDLKNKGYAILIVEHRLDMLMKYIDKLYDISAGILTNIEDKTSYFSSVNKVIPKEYTSNIGNTLIKFENVSYKIKKENKLLLHDLNFEIREGERVLILGENGAGKTTLTKLILGLKKISSGKFTYNSKYKVGSKKWFREVAVVYQNPSYELFMPSVKEELLFGGNKMEEVEEILELFGMSDLIDRHPLSLSEGQKRKLTVALALIKKPKLLILDEPTVGQDYKSLLDLVNVINKYQNLYNMTIITITHDKRCMEVFSDKILYINDGILTIKSI